MEYLTEPYINESERNVHIWCSSVKGCSHPQSLNKPTLGLVAGFYAHSDGVPVNVCYQWLCLIIDLPYGEVFESMVLFPCSDPRYPSRPLPIGGIPPVRSLKPLQQDNTNLIEEGHYMLYLYDRKQKKYMSYWPKLININFSRRSRTASQTCTPSPGSSPNEPPLNIKTRREVRMRDKRCLITGQAAAKRARGGNFTGLEVAHIFPLMGVSDPAWTDNMAANARAEVNTHANADTPNNAILLRADIHILFDDYQWSLWQMDSTSKTFMVVRFEKSGATALDREDIKTVNWDQFSSSLPTVPPPSLALIKEHFRIALLLHVRGFGRRAILI